MVKSIYYLFITILFVSCNQRGPDKYFTLLDFELPSNNFDLNVIPPASPVSLYYIVLPINEEGEKYDIIADNLSGKEIYEEHYKNNFTSYPEFLEESYKKNIFINTEFLVGYPRTIINKNDSIFVEYQRKGFNFVLKKYALRKSSEQWEYVYFTNYKTLPFERENAFVSIMYQNKFFIVFNDYAGYYMFFKDRK